MLCSSVPELLSLDRQCLPRVLGECLASSFRYAAFFFGFPASHTRSNSTQLASAIGATVIATSSSDAKLAEARSMGATHTINYRTNPDWSTEVLRLTNGKGVDLVVEVAGASTIEQSLKATRQAGVVALVGFLSDPKTTDLNNLIMPTILGGKTVYGVFMFNKQMTEAMVKLITEKKVKPKIGGVFEWKDANNALIALGKQDSVGKIIIRVGSKD